LTQQHGSPLVIVGIALLVFPKLALGLSGFETGVAVMPHIDGGPDDTPDHPVGRIRGTKHLLTTAAVIMSVFLITSSVVTTLLIPPAEFQPGDRRTGAPWPISPTSTWEAHSAAFTTPQPSRSCGSRAHRRWLVC
jgi:hypothetical protein